MRCINVHNVNQALSEGLRHIEHCHLVQDSRNGPVLVSPMPVMTTYDDPTARVLFSPKRNANPFFHLMEALWMLAGRNDVGFPMQFNKRFKEYSDDGHILHGAYGYRWRKQFQVDQIKMVIEELTTSPLSRRAVLAMWDPAAEWSAMAFGDAKDIPCNTHCYFDLLDGRLNMTVCCRSNDLWWGAYGANAVHFSILQEYIAFALQVQVGVMRQLSNNFHIYPDNLPKYDLEQLSDDARQNDHYTLDTGPHRKRDMTSIHGLKRVPLRADGALYFDIALEAFLDEPERPLVNDQPFLATVARPMYASWQAYKAKDYHVAERHAEDIAAGDWSKACYEWLERKATIRRNAQLMES